MFWVRKKVGFSELKQLLPQQTLTLTVLFLGYTGYYLCRANFAVVRPLLLADYPLLGVDKFTLANIAALGLLSYAVGKLLWGSLTDFWGGRLIFLLGMSGSVIGTLIFGLGINENTFYLGWGINRFAQSMGWLALVKIASQWFPYKSYGRVMAFLSCSFLLGDSVCRYLLGLLLESGFGWRGLFFTPAAALVAVALFCAFFLKAPPESVSNLVPAHPLNIFGEAGNFYRPQNLKRLLMPYFSSASFWRFAILSMGFTIIRETFNDWSNTFLSEAASLSAGIAAQYSAIFSLVGCASALLVGFLSDKATQGRRALFILLSLGLLTVLFLVLAYTNLSLGYNLTVLASVSFFIVGPYTLLAGAVSMDLGGKIGSSTASGLIDSAGYVGGALAGSLVGVFARDLGWQTVFLFLSIIALLTAAVALWQQFREKNLPI